MCKLSVRAESSASFTSPHKMCISAGDIWELVMKVKQLKSISEIFTGLYQPQVLDSSTVCKSLESHHTSITITNISHYQAGFSPWGRQLVMTISSLSL